MAGIEEAPGERPLRGAKPECPQLVGTRCAVNSNRCSEPAIELISESRGRIAVAYECLRGAQSGLPVELGAVIQVSPMEIRKQSFAMALSPPG